ncbi:MAG: FKBP-type peptidyl-prolyl cis-trans isomerase [Alphaproteobacteria bacterium]|nr:FKBP-type peptidyl-prolyl cis-trans isomerase [Alphaproteobacteria bacterium]
MKKIMSAVVLGGAVMLSACGNDGAKKCDSETGAKNGDTVVIDFAGYLDGEQFAGGTANGFSLVLGSGQFVPGFEDQLICAEKGETRDVNITFPTDYVPELAGKDVVFKVTVVDIIKPAVVEEVAETETVVEPAADAQ